MKTNVKACREARGLTQGEVARLLGVTESAVSRWDRGEAVPRPKMAVKLARILGVTVEDLWPIRVITDVRITDWTLGPSVFDEVE